jgi:hypothetical protein
VRDEGLHVALPLAQRRDHEGRSLQPMMLAADEVQYWHELTDDTQELFRLPAKT